MGMVKNLRLHKHPVFIVVLAFVVAVTVAGLGWVGWLTGPENFYQDLWHRLAGLRYQPQHVALVVLDEATLRQYPEPLVCYTPHFARVIQVLRQAGARIIGLDYIFQVSIAAWLKSLGPQFNTHQFNYDKPFLDQLAGGKVILAAHRGIDAQSHSKIMLPISSYLHALPGQQGDLGLINLFNDDDGVVRHYVPALADDQGQVMLTFAKLLAARAGSQDPELEIRRLDHEPDLKAWSADNPNDGIVKRLPTIGFIGPPNSFPRLSMRRLLSADAENDSEIQALKDKIVLVAYEPETMQDIHPTPYSVSVWPWPGNDMSGPEIHANILETLLTGMYPKSVSLYISSLYVTIVIFASAVLFYFLRPLPGLALGGVMAGLTALLAYLAFTHYWLLPAANVQIGIVLSYIGSLGLKLTGEEREKARMRKIFSRYVDDEVVAKLMAAERLPDLGGEVFHVTVLFADVRNFTTISEKLGPRQVVEMLNYYLSSACDAIQTKGGTVDKFIGDAVMAVFGAPVPYPDHAGRALQAALELAEKARDVRLWMQHRFRSLDLPEFAIGIGVHTGEAIVGNIGSSKRLEYTAIGDTVNAASRLESLTKELGWAIVASKSTIVAAPGVITARTDIRQVKGRQEPVEVFEVTGLKMRE
jgi:adenylate cyclase